MNAVSNASSRRTLLNPNAREFVPISLRSNSSANVTVVGGDETEPSTASENGKTFSDKTVSSDACASDEESRRYWNAQLPDDILTPDTDFFTPAVDDTIEPRPRASVSASSVMKSSTDYVADNLSWERTSMHATRQPGPAHVPGQDYVAASNVSGQLWDEELALSSVPLASRSGNWNNQYSGNGNRLMHSSLFGQTALKESSTMDALNVLCNEFPHMPEQRLAEVYQGNGCELGLTVQVLRQLQGEASSWSNVPSRSRFSPNSRALGFQAPLTPEIAMGASHFSEEFDGHHPELKRLMRRNKAQLLFDRHGPGELSLGPASFSSINSHSGLFDGELGDDRSDVSLVRHKRWLSPRNRNWDAIENILSELREEAQNHGRMGSVYREQSRQAIYAGDSVLAKLASAKEQFHNRLMKAAQTKAAEIELQKSMHDSQASNFGPGQTQLLDLRGLHVTEAIQILKQELAALRNAVRSSRQRQQVFISVGTGHQKGARTPARLLFSIKRYLTEEELLNYAEVQPGILKVIVS